MTVEFTHRNKIPFFGKSGKSPIFDFIKLMHCSNSSDILGNGLSGIQTNVEE